MGLSQDREAAGVDRRQRFGHDCAVVWLTGLPGAGKSTLAAGLARRLNDEGVACYVLDGDIVRHRLNADLGFSPEDRKENVRRLGQVAALFADAGLVCIVACISPYRADRAAARSAVASDKFYEIFVKAALEICERRDPKGLYARARRGELTAMTGIDAPYEVPEEPNLVIESGEESVEASLEKLLRFLRAKLVSD